MKTMTRFAAASLVTLLFVGCEGETKPAAPAAGGDTKPAEAPAAPGKAAKNAKSAAPANSPSNKPID